MASWSKQWTNIESINSGNEFSDYDIPTASALNPLYNNVGYLKTTLDNAVNNINNTINNLNANSVKEEEIYQEEDEDYYTIAGAGLYVANIHVAGIIGANYYSCEQTTLAINIVNTSGSYCVWQEVIVTRSDNPNARAHVKICLEYSNYLTTRVASVTTDGEQPVYSSNLNATIDSAYKIAKIV